MAYAIVVPRLGWSMEEGTFVRWLKRDGDTVNRGEALFELEGEKAIQEIEAVDDGILWIPPDAPQAGSTVSVGTILGYLVAEGEPAPSQALLAPQQMSEQADAVPRGIEVQSGGESSSRIGATNSRSAAESKLAISPRAKRFAKEMGIDWSQLSGSGAGGRIRECDVRTAINSGTQQGARMPISKRRRAIAERLVVSHQQTVPVTLTTRVDATNLVNVREQFRSADGATVIPSYQDIITKLVAEVLLRHPTLAGRWDGDAIVLPSNNEFHIGMAVDTEDGLLVPVIRDVGRLSLIQLVDYARQLIHRVRSSKLSAADLQGSVFTITNLGAYGIDAFTPTIHYPETAILGLGAIRREPVMLDNGQIVARYQLTLSLTFDHRIIDGAPAARFLRDLAGAIASPYGCSAHD